MNHRIWRESSGSTNDAMIGLKNGILLGVALWAIILLTWWVLT